jgi:hypothetical protein
MSRGMKEKIERVLGRVKDQESDLSISRLELINRFRYSEKEKKLLVLTNDYSANRHRHPNLPKPSYFAEN